MIYHCSCSQDVSASQQHLDKESNGHLFRPGCSGSSLRQQFLPFQSTTRMAKDWHATQIHSKKTLSSFITFETEKKSEKL